MHTPTHHLTTLLLLATAILGLATPVPRGAAYSDIEKRWAEGIRDECQRELHSGLSHRDMTPAWSMHARDADADEDFASASWTHPREVKRTAGLLGRMQAFVERVTRQEAGVRVASRNAGEVTERQRPWKPEYYFSK
ncbi:hypothetical protein DOTSEDRAFT_33858 [Dothistroma septosporum NZE10]|uniref:Uncharacterized protein n=1 Tax=Dothistroma septosporum (strain NZE10 / CBS 128990) TaxID=675120 RepID=N1PPM0_DOTSN|nr:hypothetical protein DOTSEDRAFT_33858 [Dothistroma septosporum NZE10]